MNAFILAALIGLGPIGLALLFLCRTLSSRTGLEVAPDDGLALQAERYRPMERLLLEDDFVFLARQRGFSRRAGRRFRRQRRSIFRGYLRSLKGDFGRIFLACQTLAVHSAEDRGDLAARLIRLRLSFALGMLAVEARLILHAAGVGTVDVRPLVDSLETVQAQVRLLFAMPQTAAGTI
jgi:hypothetical protein